MLSALRSPFFPRFVPEISGGARKGACLFPWMIDPDGTVVCSLIGTGGGKPKISLGNFAGNDPLDGFRQKWWTLLVSNQRPAD
jgi:hypothetical protein